MMMILSHGFFGTALLLTIITSFPSNNALRPSSSFSPFGRYKSSIVTNNNKDAVVTRTSIIGTGSTISQSSSMTTSPKSSSSSLKVGTISSIDEASNILSQWDAQFVGANPERYDSNDSNYNLNMNNMKNINNDYLYTLLPDAVRYLNMVATKQYNEVGKCRIILGICANNAADGTHALRSWVTELQLPRGLLYGLDEDGVPLVANANTTKKGIGNSNGIYLKYNSLYAKKRKTKTQRKNDSNIITPVEQQQQQQQRKPGDVLASSYSGKYRGVYFQVELKDKTFRQYLLPANIF